MKILAMEDPSFTVPAESPGIVLSKRRLLPIEMPWNWWLVIQRWGFLSLVPGEHGMSISV